MPGRKNIDINFFKTWSVPMAYLVGFFAADGYMTVNKRGGQYWALDIGDKKIISEIKSVIKSKHKISTRNRKDGQYITYRLQVGSNAMCEDLRKLGFDERKTKRLSMPNIPTQYFSDFIRGYFDGDGNVWMGKVHKNNRVPNISIQTVFTSCSKEFLENLKEILESSGVKKGVLRRGNGNFYRLTYSVNNSLKLYDFMYNNLGTSKLFLRRKKDVFEKYIKMRP